MDNLVSAAGAKRRFSQILRAVRNGSTFVVTAHGKEAARTVLFERLEAQDPSNRAASGVGPWSRDELHDL